MDLDDEFIADFEKEVRLDGNKNFLEMQQSSLENKVLSRLLSRLNTPAKTIKSFRDVCYNANGFRTFRLAQFYDFFEEMPFILDVKILKNVASTNNLAKLCYRLDTRPLVTAFYDTIALAESLERTDCALAVSWPYMKPDSVAVLHNFGTVHLDGEHNAQLLLSIGGRRCCLEPLASFLHNLPDDLIEFSPADSDDD